MPVYQLDRCPSYFTRYGYRLTLTHDDGTPFVRYLPIEGHRHLFGDHEPAYFYGNNASQVRAEAIAYAKQFGARRA